MSVRQKERTSARERKRISKVKYSSTNIKQKRAKQQSKLKINPKNHNISIVMYVSTLHGKNSVFYSLFSPETFTAELHLGLKAQICHQIAFKKCRGGTQKSNVKCTKVHFFHEPHKKPRIRFSQKTR